MKKKYSRPEIKVKAIGTETLLAASPSEVEYGGKQSIEVTGTGSDDAGGAKRSLFDKTFDWDEE